MNIADLIALANPAGIAQNVLSSRGQPLGVSAKGKLRVLDAQFGAANLFKKKLIKQRMGLLTTQVLGSGNFIYYIEEFTIPADANSFQLFVANAHPTSHPQIRARLAVSEIATATPASSAINDVVQGGVSYNGLGDTPLNTIWINLLKNGASPTQLEAMPSSTVNNPWLTAFDPYPLTTLPRTDSGRTTRVVKVLVEWGGYENAVATATNVTLATAGAGITGWEQDTDITVPPYGNFWRTRNGTGAAGVDTFLATNSSPDNAATNYHAPIALAYTLQSTKGVQCIAIGDSEIEGSGDTAMDKYSHLQEAIHLASTSALPFELLNAAQAGTSTTAWVTMAGAYIPQCPNSIVFLLAGSPNTTMPLGDTLQSATIVNPGSGGTPGAVVLTGTTGTGTAFQINATIGAGGTVTSLGAIRTSGTTIFNGPYTVLPTNIAAEPVTGGGLTGCTLSLTFIGTNNTLWKRDIAKIRAIAEQYGCALVLLTTMPSNTAGKDYKGSDPMRVAYNTEVLASGELCLDCSAIMSGLTSGTQVQMVVGYTTDGIHPNATGRAALRDGVSHPFLQLLGGA